MKKPLSFGWGVALCAALAVPSAASADPASAALGGLAYRAIGPAIAGGRTTAVAGSDLDPAVYYAGGAGGGIFKSVDGGVSWRAVFDTQDVAPVGAIAVSPRDPNDVWVGTGEANPRNDVEEGAGIWHSTDGGNHWTHAGLDDAGSISTLSIDPRNPRIVVAAVLGHVFRDSAMRGIYVTRDAGAHWTRALYAGPSSGASDVVRVPDHPSTLFAGLWQFRRQPWKLTSGGPDGGLYRSDDNGATWRKLTGHGLPGGVTGRIGIAAARRGRIYAIVQARGGDIWRSDDGGGSWHVMPHQPMVGARRFYFSRLYVDPANGDRVMNVSLILSLSRDGARTFKPIATEAGWDYHNTWWSRDGRRVINGNDEGVILSYDGAAHWSQPYDLPFAQPYHVAVDDALPSYRVCIGLQDNGSWCGASSSENGLGVLNRDWLTIGPGDGMWNVFDPADHALVWNTTTNSDPGQVYLYDGHTQQMREISPIAREVQDAASALRYRFNWDTPVAFGSDGQALAGGNVLFRSADRGVHWTAVSPDLTRNQKSHQGVSGGPIDQDASGAEISDTILCIAPAKAAAGQIWVGTDDGLVQLSRDNAATWANVTPAALPAWGRVYTVEPGHFSAGTAYLAVDRHMSGDDRPYLLATDDYGASWRSISGDLPRSLFVRVIREDPTDRNLLYAGTRRGVFVSFDRGAHWHALRLNMPATAIYDLQIQPDARDLVVASHGRGVWILDDLRPLRDWAHTPATQVTLYAPRDAYRTFRNAPVNAFLDGKLPSGEFVGANRPYGAPLTYYLPRAAKKVQLAILDANGTVVRHVPAKALTRHAGMNRVAWDLAEDGPVRWNGTFEQNKGPETGPEAVPGPYVVRLTVDGAVATQPVLVKADPRDPAPPDEAERRHAFLAAENAQLSRVDAMLNAIDARLRRAAPASGAPLRALRARLTLDPQNIEDLRTPPRVRERLLDLIGRIATSYQGPTAAHEEEARTVRAEYDALVAAYEKGAMVP